jgi:hypothetical protein
MIAEKPYKDINQVMDGIRTQIIDSVDYCYSRFSGFTDPRELFAYLKQITTYVPDPERIELLQTAQTLFENNYHGTPGAGDCDCFTILAHACFIANGFGVSSIVLTGRDPHLPVHIYSLIKNGSQVYIFDLTNPFIDMERFYPYKQVLPIKFHK